jgi:hypothetical protein
MRILLCVQFDMASPASSSAPPQVLSCPCGLTQDVISEYKRLDERLKCTAEWADDSGKICEKPLGAHPHERDLNPSPIPQQPAGKPPTTPIKLTVRGEAKVFPCPVDWTVKEACEEIQAIYDVSGGGIECNKVSMRRTDVIGNAVGDFTFVGGRDLIQPAGRAPMSGLLTVFCVCAVEPSCYLQFIIRVFSFVFH